MKVGNFNFIQKFNYTNSFWENTDVLYQHSKQRFDEYLLISNLYQAISSALNDFSESLLDLTKPILDTEIDYESIRSQGVIKVINFINRISQNLKRFSKNLITISNNMKEKVTIFQSNRELEKQCKEYSNKYKDYLKKLNTKKENYNDTVEAVIENFLINKYKETKSPTDLKPKLDSLNKKKQDYKNEVKNCEEIRTEFVKNQRSLLEKEQDFEKECTEDIKSSLNKMVEFYNQFLQMSQIDKDTIGTIKKINAENEIQIFCEYNRDIISSPSRIIFQEYNQNVDKYYKFDVIKNKIKNITEEESKELKKDIVIEVNKFLEETVYKMNEDNDMLNKYSQIADDILNKKLKEEDYVFIINEFHNKYSDFMEWKRATIKDQNYMKVGLGWDNRFDSMHVFLHIFNKLRMYNKKLEKDNFYYFVKIMKIILDLNEGDEVDYNLCDLVIILASTFYSSEEKDGKEEKKYVAEEIKNCKIFQNFEFWIGLVKDQINVEIIKERLKEKKMARRTTFFGGGKNLVNTNKEGKKKEEDKVDTVEQYNKIIMAKLMSVSYNLVQFVNNSDTINKALYNIFIYYKLNQNDKKNIVELLKFQIMNDGYTNLNIDEDLLFKNKIDEHYKERIENKNEDNTGDKKNENEENKKNDNLNQKEEKKEELNELDKVNIENENIEINLEGNTNIDKCKKEQG